MIKDITIGQYFPGDSFLHRLDSRMKIVLTFLLIAGIFISKNIIALAVIIVSTIALIGISKIPFKMIYKSIKPLSIIIIITSFLNLFYGQGDPIAKIGPLKITVNGIETAIFMAVRIITLVVVSSLLTYTTSPTDLTDAIERLLKPLKLLKIDVHSFAMIMTIALRFIPTLIEEIDKIMNAQKSRGAQLDSGKMIEKIKALIPVLIPLFVSSFRRANELAYAMECRCYTGGNGRTKMKVLKLGVRDYISLIAVILFLVLLVFMNIKFKNII